MTGVSGSGKSSLVNEILYRGLARALHHSGPMPGPHKTIRGLEHVDKVIDIDQSPIGRTPRSNAATYTGAFTEIRDLFTRLPESKVRGYKPGRFCFNVKGGRCEACGGDGVVKIEMHFLPDVYVRCEVCAGKRYNRETLEVAYKGRSIAEVLDMTVEESLGMFENIPTLRRKLGALRDVGLGYIHLGQPATTLSGGEAQRVKLATELSQGLHRPDALHPRRADDGTPLRGHPDPARGARPARGCRQHRHRDRAPARRDHDGRPHHRPRARGGRRGGTARRRGDTRGGRGDRRVAHRRGPAVGASGALVRADIGGAGGARARIRRCEDSPADVELPRLMVAEPR